MYIIKVCTYCKYTTIAKKLLEITRDKIRLRHYSYQTEKVISAG